MYSEYLHTYPDHQAIATPYLYVLFMLLMFGNLLEAPNTLFLSNEQRLQYSSLFSSRQILDPKYLDLNFFMVKHFDCYQLFQNTRLIPFMSLKLPYYPELVRVFYSNLKILDGTLISEVHGIPMIIDESVFFLLTQLPSQGAPFEGTIVD